MLGDDTHEDQKPASERSLGRLTLSCEGISLWPVTSADHEFLFHCAVSEGNGPRWRYHGQVPSPDAFVGDLYNDVLAHFTVRDGSGERVGYVVSYAANLRCRHAYVGAVLAEYSQQVSVGSKALSLFVGYLFDVWDLLGLYAEVPEFVNQEIARSTSGSIGTSLPFELVGRKPRFHFQAGRHWDDLLFYLPVERWRARLSST